MLQMVKKIEICGHGSIQNFLKEIKNVLHVNNCDSNLLFIRKFSKEINCEIIFSSKNQFLQDVTSKIMIGEGFFQNELYFLNSQKINFKTKVQYTGNLWQKELGIPPIRFRNVFYIFQI